jgi:tetratricopeptide (TPR) repeat protein
VVAPGLLTTAEATELLVARLGHARLAEEYAAAAELVTFCGGLPLALNIVAARVATPGSAVSLVEHAKAMRQTRSRLDELSTGDLTTDVRAVFSWSYRMLTPAAASLFRILALHPGPDCSEAAAISVSGRSAEQTHTALAELSAAHLLAEHAPQRYVFHDLLRAYASELVEDFDDESARRAAVLRTLDHYLHTAQAATVRLAPAWIPLPLDAPAVGVIPEPVRDSEDANAWFEAEFPVLLGIVALAVGSGHDQYAWQLPWMLRTFFDRRGHWREMEHTHQAALAAALRLGDITAEATARRGLGRAYLRLRDYDAALTHTSRALDVYEQQGDSFGQANAHHDLALVAEQQGDHAKALHHARQALNHFEAVGGPAAQANSLNTVGWFHALLGNYQEALDCCTRAIELFQGLGDPAGEAGTWDSVGYAHHCLGDHARATSAYRASIEGYRRIGDRFYEAGTLVRLGDTHLAADDPDAAAQAWHEAFAILDELQHPDAERVAGKIRDLPQA